jgi:hypothetical protein
MSPAPDAVAGGMFFAGTPSIFVAGSEDSFPIRMPGGTGMNTLTIRITDDLANRLKSAARARRISVNKLITEISVQALTAYDAETRFKAMASGADIPGALKVLDRLDV